MPHTAALPWLSLPDDLTEKILELLPLSDYVRFPAVCRRWRSIQTDHRRRHAPSPPPMVRFPWFIPVLGSDAETVSCYSPFEGRTYRIKIPMYSHYSPDYGWVLCRDSIFNPISQIHIPFPGPVGRHRIYKVVVSPPPSLVVFVLKNYPKLLLFRLEDPRWTKLQLPLANYWESITDAVTVGGRLYCISRCYERPTADHLLIVNPLPTPPTVCSYRMEDWANTLPEQASILPWQFNRLVESDDEVLMVKRINDGRFHVLRPDVSKRVWMRVESLGDRLLLFRPFSVVSLIAVDVGLKKNCIYFRDGNWKVFDMGIGKVMDASFLDGPLRPDLPNIFMPSIC